LLYGPPGVGKTTVSTTVVQFTDIQYFSFGNVRREHLKRGTPEGYAMLQCDAERKKYPAELVRQLIESSAGDVLQQGKGILFDGFPLHRDEAYQFIDMVNRYRINVGKMFILEAPFEELVRRISSRRICSDCLTQITLKDLTQDTCVCGGSLMRRTDDDPTVLIESISFIQALLRILLVF
jgi:adenylate kinase